MEKCQYLGSTKISDGLYIGDQLAAKDIDTIVMNHITHIINCSSKDVPNHFETYGIKYLSYNFQQSDKQIIFDESDNILNQIYNFIQQAKQQGQSCLIHTNKGHSIAFVLFGGYFMKKFQWSLYKTLEFLDSRLQKIQLKGNYFRQLKGIETRLSKFCKLSNDWILKSENMEDLILRNTYLNSIQNGIADIYKVQSSQLNKKALTIKNTKLIWKDQRQNNIMMKCTSIQIKQKVRLKSILKTSNTKFKTETSVSSIDNNIKQSTNPNEELRQRQTFASQKLSIKKKIPAIPLPLGPVSVNYQKKIINLFNPLQIQRSGSQKKVIQKQSSELKKISSKQQQKTKNSSINYGQSPQAKDKKKQQKRKSDIENKQNIYKNNGKTTTISYQYPGLMTFFKNNTEKEIKKNKQNLNKSLESQSQKQSIKKQRFQTQANEQRRKEEKKSYKQDKRDDANKLTKKTICQKGRQNLGKDIKQGQIRLKSQSDYIESNNTKDKLVEKGFVTLNLKQSNNNNNWINNSKQRNSQELDKVQMKKTQINNYIQNNNDGQKNNKSLRGCSPSFKSGSIDKKQSDSKSKLDKMKPNLTNKIRVPSPGISSQYSISLKQANNIINSIFSNSNYKPKWKF